MNKVNISLALKNIEEKIRQVHTLILSKPQLREFVDTVHPIPNAYNGGGKIKLIVIGQDPTIVNKASRKRITTVLDLDKPGKMQRYIFRLCEGLGINPLKELYATNLFKNFFEEPPSFASEVLGKFVDLWLPILKEEISLYPDTPVITLGDDVLQYVTAADTDKCVRNYWGYSENWRMGVNLQYKHILPNENQLGRLIFPFPRQPSILKQFYMERCETYLKYISERKITKSQEAA